MIRIDTLLSDCASRHLTIDAIERDGLPFSRCALFGAGQRGVCMKRYFEKRGCATVAFLDNNPHKQGTFLQGVPVVSLKRFKEGQEDIPVFIASQAYKEISAQLLVAGIRDAYAIPNLSFYFMPDLMENHAEEVHAVFDLLKDEDSRKTFASIVKSYITGDDGYYAISSYEQYFHPLVKPEPGEIILDGGAFDGDTCNRSFQVSNPGRILAVEPLAASYRMLLERTKRHAERCDYVNKALWSEERLLHFACDPHAPEGNAVSTHGAVAVPATTIDTMLRDFSIERMDLIKLDVEGSERQALQGARETIERFHPKLQVCLYHSLKDLWEIPLFIESNFPGYDFHIGHHMFNPHETVLYAV